MRKILDTLTLKHQVARPMGYIRYAVFILSFLIARLPLWFVVTAYFLNSKITVTYTLFILFAIVVCRVFIESEISGGKNSFLFFLGIHILKGASAILLYFSIFGIIFYIFSLHNDNYGKISMILVIMLIYFLIHENNKHKYWFGYYISKKMTIVICLLWFSIIFLGNSVFMNIITLSTIYLLEFYNLICNKPLSLLPNREAIYNN